MIVVLHGMPGSDGQKQLHETTSPDFKEVLNLRVAATPGMVIGEMLGFNIPAATQHTLAFRFTHHDGTYYHYKFTGEIDGE